MQIVPITIPPKKLAQSILSTDSTFKLNNIEGWDGEDLTAADLGTQHFVVFKNDTGTKIEIMEIDPATIASASITISNRGLKFDGQQTEVTANKLNWAANETTVMLGTDVPQMLEQLVNLSDAQTVAGVKTFSSFPVTPSSDPTTDYQVANKKYADDLAIAGSPDMTLTVKGISEEATAAEINAGTQAGATSAELAVNPKYLKDSTYYTQRPTADEKAALVGTSGTPSTTNKFVTDDDVSASTSADKVVRANGSGQVDNGFLTTLNPTTSLSLNSLAIDFELIASDDLQTSADTEITDPTGSYVKRKEILLNDFSGTVTIKWEDRMGTGGTVFSRVYKNGVAHGAEFSSISSAYVVNSEDLAFSSGDLIQLYIKNVGGNNPGIKNFRVYYTKVPLDISNTVNLN